MYCSKRSFHRVTLLIVVIATVAASGQIATAQKNSKSFEARFWQYLIGNNYKNWAPAPGQDGDFYSGQMPHGALLKMYINRDAASNIEVLKSGSVVVLENYRSDRSLKSISVMYRTEGFNPEANDWYWVEYNPDGSVVEDVSTAEEPQEGSDVILELPKATKLMGKANQCISCHQRAKSKDFVFFNDRDNSGVGQKREPITLR